MPKTLNDLINLFDIKNITKTEDLDFVSKEKQTWKFFGEFISDIGLIHLFILNYYLSNIKNTLDLSKIPLNSDTIIELNESDIYYDDDYYEILDDIRIDIEKEDGWFGENYFDYDGFIIGEYDVIDITHKDILFRHFIAFDCNGMALDGIKDLIRSLRKFEVKYRR
jgi:hypothetical protein